MCMPLLCGAMVACTDKARQQALDSTRSGVPAAKPIVASGTGAVAAADTAGCGLAPTNAHDNPDTLLAQFLARDAEGEFAQSSTWRDQAVYCPLESPGWDGFTLISSYRITPLHRTADTVRVQIDYTREGLLEQDASGYLVKPDAGPERDTLTLARTPYGWRVSGWDVEPHLLPSGALKLPTMNVADKQKLRAMVKR